MSRRVLLALLFLLALAPGLAADDHPNTDRGFSAEKAFMSGEIDNVNTFNGNLVLTIPIGGSYPTGGGLSYGLTLVYNSNLWDFQERTDDSTMITYQQALPQRTSNAGLGWLLTLGRLLSPDAVENDTNLWLYQGSDGSEHAFYPTLHVGDADELGDSPMFQAVSYTRDGSYLRMKVVTAGLREIEFPNGQIHHFNFDNRVDQIKDRFENALNIAYGTVWTLTDSQGRVQKVHFQTMTQDEQAIEVVDKVELTAFGGATATYDFSYASVTIARGCPHTELEEVMPNLVQVPLLTSISLPDGSSYQMPVSDYITELNQSSPVCRSSGAIRGLTLPTLGRLQYTYQDYVLPNASGKIHRSWSPGVKERRTRNAAGTELGLWKYETSLAPGNQELANTVIDPLGHKTKRYFMPQPGSYQYSLPFNPNLADGPNRFLSTQTFNAAGTLQRSTYVRYDADQRPAVPADLQELMAVNRREAASHTVFNDDGNRFADVNRSDFDGTGHYRTEATAGNFGAGDVRTSTTAFNPSRGTYQFDPVTNQQLTGHNFTKWPHTQAWVLETFESRQTTEGTAALAKYCFDANTGFLLRERRLKNGTAENIHDVVAVYTPSAGNLATEQYFGGDPQSLAINTPLCSMALPLAAYQIDHTYQFGARATSQYSGMSFRSLDQTIDQNSGLPRFSRDTAGLQTEYKYDTLGRLTWIQPPLNHGGWTEYVYNRALSASSLASVFVRRRNNGSETAPTQAQSQIFFDALGRVWQENQSLPTPAGSFNVRETLYDAAGHKASVSELQATPNQKTQLLFYDPFGRATTIRPPDGAAHEVTFNYFGTRVVERTVKIATTQGVETASTTTETYDRQGRLSKVAEPSGAGGALVTTTYSYDVGNRLRQVQTVSSAGTQNRFFTYDNLGFLTSETHPEKGTAGNGNVTYSDYDARGHARRKIDGPNDLTFIYDSAERLTQVQETVGARLLKTFSYAPSNGANDFRQGKLQVATRYNYPTINGTPHTIQVAETYVYGGRDGRVSRRDTVSTSTPANNKLSGSFTQSFAYNAIGLVNSLTYPTCTHSDCTQVTPVFSDVPVGHPDRLEIEAIYPGVTSGCDVNPLRYCPGSTTNRAEMALFLLRAKEGPAYAPPACTTPMFSDVPCSHPFSPWINEIARRGITGGCGGGNFCPLGVVNNSQMAVFLLAMLGLSPPACTTAPFLDVSCGDFAAAWIAEAKQRGFMPGCGGGRFCPLNATTRGQMAGLMTRTFDIPVKTDPNTARNVQLTYTQGMLTDVTVGGLLYGTFVYHPNLLVSQINHSNGMIETQGNDPNAMRRPSSLGAVGAFTSWSSGTYAYDGAGNIKSIGTSWFTYDKVSRLTTGTIFTGPTGGGTQRQQTYAFDPFGNLTNISGFNGRATPTSASTNRLTGSVSYDSAGNLTSWNTATYQYDRFNQMTRMTSGGEDWAYVYTADDERIWSFDIARNTSRWSLRDLGGKLLREYVNDDRWSVGTDYIYRDGLLLAAETQKGRRHFHLDHLGTPRLITRGSGYQAAYHAYMPFGEEATAFNQDNERMKFTGHERDLASLAGPGDDLDYMHARHCSPVTARFLSVDPAMESADPFVPQSWNRYNYVQGNPLVYVDPTGELLVFAGSTADLEKLRKLVNDSLHGYELVINKNGTAQLVATNVQGPASPEQAALASALSSAINRAEVVRIGVESGASDILTGSYDYEAIDIEDMGALGSGPAVSGASALAHEVVEQTAKQVFGLEYEKAHARATAAQNAVSGFTRGRTNKDLLDLTTGTGYLLTEQSQGNSTTQVIIKWVNGNIVKVIRK